MWLGLPPHPKAINWSVILNPCLTDRKCGSTVLVGEPAQRRHTFDSETPWEIRAPGSQNAIIRHERATVPPIVLWGFHKPQHSAVNCLNGRVNGYVIPKQAFEIQILILCSSSHRKVKNTLFPQKCPSGFRASSSTYVAQ